MTDSTMTRSCDISTLNSESKADYVEWHEACEAYATELDCGECAPQTIRQLLQTSLSLLARGMVLTYRDFAQVDQLNFVDSHLTKAPDTPCASLKWIVEQVVRDQCADDAVNLFIGDNEPLVEMHSATMTLDFMKDSSITNPLRDLVFQSRTTDDPQVYEDTTASLGFLASTLGSAALYNVRPYHRLYSSWLHLFEALTQGVKDAGFVLSSRSVDDELDDDDDDDDEEVGSPLENAEGYADALTEQINLVRPLALTFALFTAYDKGGNAQLTNDLLKQLEHLVHDVLSLMQVVHAAYEDRGRYETLMA